MSPSFSQLLILALMSIGAFALWSHRRAHEAAVDQARRYCHQRGLQLLDQTVALERMRAVRLANGRRGFRRQYRFELTHDRVHRLSGELALVGERLERIEVFGLETAGDVVAESTVHRQGSGGHAEHNGSAFAQPQLPEQTGRGTETGEG